MHVTASPVYVTVSVSIMNNANEVILIYSHLPGRVAHIMYVMRHVILSLGCNIFMMIDWHYEEDNTSAKLFQLTPLLAPCVDLVDICPQCDATILTTGEVAYEKKSRR